MSRLYGWLVVAALLANAARADTATDAAIGILGRIATTCEEQGFAACESQLRGLDPVFTYLRTYAEMQQTEAEFVAFVRTRYGLPGFTMKDMAAHIDPKIAVTVGRKTFDGQVRSVKVLPDGYDVEFMDKGAVELRRIDGVWVAQLPKEASEKARAVVPYTAAAELKRSIMTYRMLEAQIMNYDLDHFAERFVADLTPLVVALEKREDLVAQVPDWEHKLEDVMKFYSQFKTDEDMRAEIRRRNGLKP